MSDLPTPNTRKEQYLNAIATGNAGGLPTPITREEEYLDAIAKSGGGGGGGTTNYNALDNKPQIAGTTLQGNKSLADLGIASANDVSDSEKNIYAVMGEMGAKNLIPYPYYEDTEEDRGITWTNNADGTITITGTATADSAHNLSQRTNTGKLYLPNGKYKLSGCPSGGSDNTYYLEAVCTKNSGASRLGIDNGTGVDITVNGDDYGADGAYVMVRGIVKNGYAVTNPIVFKPMLRLASDTDDTYQRYAKTNKQLTDEIANKVDKVEGKGLSTNDYSDTEKGKVADNTAAIEAIVNVNGAKNWALLEPESESKDGITFTCTDGKSLTLSGTASDNTGKSYNLETPITGNVIVTLEQTANKVTLSYNDGTDWHTLPADGKVNGTIAQVGFNIVSGTVINETVYLMIRDARIKDPTYVPYAMTNEQLTERVIWEEKQELTPTWGTPWSNYGYCYYRKRGTTVELNLSLTDVDNASSLSIYTLPDGYRPIINIGKTALCVLTSISNAGLFISTDGVIRITNGVGYYIANVTFETV